jgi:hypothetical protein
MPIPAILDGFVDVLSGLEDLASALSADGYMDPKNLQHAISRLGNYRRQCAAYVRTTKFLQQKTNNTAMLLADTLALKNQSVTQELNINMLRLTRSAIFITILTVFYLPWTLLTVGKHLCTI